ncbi:LysR family transcriptional regulator [Aeromonas hydrophila]|uniref:LysR family transcriptional regulator n=1 Tax=Aeromonas hydrophila TaxID=644 RepID=UPI0021E6C42F|nr:LysR family transcriptional regulator [Aeromonas hydrophila]MCV3278382.1 LysR family transcriptional regulator [Aeromonas hydrophila]
MANSLNGLDLFASVVEAGSFAQAAERLHLTRSAVGKGIARLEQRLGVQLFHRTTRSQSLTEEGALFHRHCLRALEEVRLGEAALASNKLTLNGSLKVSMPVLFGQLCVAPLLLELAQAHPGLALSLSFSDRKVDLVEEGFDLVIRNGEPPDSLDLVARRLGEHGMTLCAAPSYLAERGEPMTLADLAEHEGIAYLRQGRVLAWQWQLDGQWQSVRPTGRLQLDDLHAITQAAIAGFGLAWLPSWLARPHLERGELREVLGSLKGRRYPINALWPHSPHLPLKTRMAIDWLASRLPERLASVAGAGSHDQ